jgi:hypothetical protein
MPGEALAPQRGRNPVPGLRQRGQTRAPGATAQGAHQAAGGVQLLLHPLHADRRVRRGQFERGGQLAALQAAGGLQPPQGQQLLVVGVQPPGRLGHLQPLAAEAEPQDAQVHEVGLRVRRLDPLVQHRARRRTRQRSPVPADLANGHRHRPGPERLRLAQPGQAADDAQHRLLDQIVDVVVPAQGVPDDVVDKRQRERDDLVERGGVAALRRGHGAAWKVSAPGDVHGGLAPRPADALKCTSRRGVAPERGR